MAWIGVLFRYFSDKKTKKDSKIKIIAVVLLGLLIGIGYWLRG